jgi:hypothetical protein
MFAAWLQDGSHTLCLAAHAVRWLRLADAGMDGCHCAWADAAFTCFRHHACSIKADMVGKGDVHGRLRGSCACTFVADDVPVALQVRSSVWKARRLPARCPTQIPLAVASWARTSLEATQRARLPLLYLNRKSSCQQPRP